MKISKSALIKKLNINYYYFNKLNSMMYIDLSKIPKYKHGKLDVSVGHIEEFKRKILEAKKQGVINA